MSLYSQFPKYYEQIFPFREQTFSFLAGYWEQKMSKVLDVGCGTGHYTGRFAGKGACAWGIDLDKNMITYARNTYPGAEFLCLNMTELKNVKGKFSLVYSVGNVLSHLTNSQCREFIKTVFSLVEKNGFWIFQVVNWDFILGKTVFEFPEIRINKPDLVFSRRYEHITPQQVSFVTDLSLAGRSLFSDDFPLYPARASDYLNWHIQAGFRPAGHYRDYNRSEFDPKTWGGSIFVFQPDV